MEELPAIGKTRDPNAGVKYAFRGIENITAECQELFAKYGVVTVPLTRSRETKDIVVNSNPWTDTFLEVDWRIYGPGGITDCIKATTFGIGRDNSDKGANKAQTAAYKYLLLELLCISDPKDDGDKESHATDSGEAQTTTRRSSTRRTKAKATDTAAPAPEAAASADGSEPVNEKGEVLANQGQKNMLRLRLRNDRKIVDNEEVHDVVSAYVGREITSLNDLTAAEASIAIDKARVEPLPSPS
jgi:hypothetical protein